MDGPLKGRVIAAIEEVAQQETNNLVLTPKTPDEYLRIVGKVQGLRLAIQLIEDTYSEYMGS